MPEEAANNSYFEQVVFGYIDGITAPYNTNCNAALKQTNDSLFRIWDYRFLFMPQNTAKF